MLSRDRSEENEGITGISNKSKPHLIHVLEENEEAEQETCEKRDDYAESPHMTLEPKIQTIQNNNDIAQQLNEDSRILTSLPADAQKLESVDGSIMYNQQTINQE